MNSTLSAQRNTITKQPAEQEVLMSKKPKLTKADVAFIDRVKYRGPVMSTMSSTKTEINDFGGSFFWTKADGRPAPKMRTLKLIEMGVLVPCDAGLFDETPQSYGVAS